MKTLGLVFLLALYSCGKDTLSGTTASSSQAVTAKVLTVPTDLKGDVDLINQEIKAYTQMPQIDILIIEYSSDSTLADENEACGICISGTNPKILLYSPDWVASLLMIIPKTLFKKLNHFIT